MRTITRMPNSGSQSVVLVNGLWLADPALWFLERHVRRAGFRVYPFSYPSVRQDLRANAARLNSFLSQIPGEVVHLVGYSLGGVIVRGLFHWHPQQRPGRIVLLGSPQTGNRPAQATLQNRFGRRLLGRSVAELVAGVPRQWGWPARETGIIAGSRSVGLGRLAATLATPNDGTVAVEETTVPGPYKRLVLPVAHFAMLFSPAVAGQVSEFLHAGHFKGESGLSP